MSTLTPTPSFKVLRSGSRQLLAGLTVVGSLFATGAQAQILFNFDYSMNAPGVGFLDPVAGPARQAALAQAGTLYSNLFSSYFTNTATLLIEVSSTDDASSGTLASAGSFFNVPAPGFGAGEVIRTKLATGVDLNGTESDGNVDVNWGWNWQLDPNAPVVGETFDFYAAVFHELTHAIGFANVIDFAGTGFGDGTNGTPGTFATFDQFLVDGAGTQLIGNDFLTNQAAWVAARETGVFFGGANARAANGGAAVDMYSPATYSNGSSVGHLNTDNPAYASFMMKHNRDFGPEQRGWSPIEVGILTDIGYTLVPEPSTYALLLAGLAGVVGATRRRQKQAA